MENHSFQTEGEKKAQQNIGQIESVAPGEFSFRHSEFYYIEKFFACDI